MDSNCRQAEKIHFKYWTERNGSAKYAEKLIKLIADRVNVILKFPNSFKQTSHPNTRVAAIGHFSIFYKVTESQLIITAFWDNRQDPKKLLNLLNENIT